MSDQNGRKEYSDRYRAGCHCKGIRRYCGGIDTAVKGFNQEEVVARLKERGIVSNRSIYSQIECGCYNIRISELAAFTEIFGVDDYNVFFKEMEQDR